MTIRDFLKKVFIGPNKKKSEVSSPHFSCKPTPPRKPLKERLRQAAAIPLKSKRGIALLVAIFTFVMVSGISLELLEETQVEYIAASQGVNQLKAYYGARSGVELSLLRILIYKKAVALAGEALGDGAQILEQIWQVPFIWPPQIPEKSTEVSKDLVQSAVDDSLIDVTFTAVVSSEGSKIDLNDLASPSKALAEKTKKQVLRILTNRVNNQDDGFADFYASYDFERLVNNITDWVDEDSESLNGGDESSFYRELQSDSIPPNQSFKTLEELHMVADMTDDIYNELTKHVTVYGVAGIQVNTATKDVIQSIDEGIDEEVADAVLKRRSNPDEGGPFTNLEDFIGFLDQQGVRLDAEELQKEGLPLYFDSELNFRVVSTGNIGRTTREIVAIVFDFDRVKERLSEQVKADEEDDENGNGDNSDEAEERKELEEKCKDEEGDAKYECLCEADQNDQEKFDECKEEEKKKAEDAKKDDEGKKTKEAPKGRPNVIYWFEQ